MELGATLSATREQYQDVKAREVNEEEGESVQLLLRLPNGESATRPFKMGHTVAFVKLEIEKEHGLPMDRLKLSLGDTGKPLLDILCLADYPQIRAGAPNEVAVALADEQ